MSPDYHIFVFGIGLAFNYLIEIGAASFLEVNITIDVNEKTIVDESYPRDYIPKFSINTTSIDEIPRGNGAGLRFSKITNTKDYTFQCPPDFPNLERHDTSNHGDVCRN